MADNTVSHKLNGLNKKIIEVKKKIQLSEGQRKANFEECDAKKRESSDRIGRLKREVKELQLEFAKAKNNNEAAGLASSLSRESSAIIKKRNLREANAMFDEDNIRLRKKLDLVKYQVDKKTKKLLLLQKEYDELINGKVIKMGALKPSSIQSKKTMTRLENQLHRVSVMQMEADTVRKKYRSVRASLKADASFYASYLDSLEESIREQQSEINRLQNVKAEAIALRDTTKETLTKQEIEAMHTTKERETVIQEYRKRVEDRKIELERLERMMFSTRAVTRDEFAPSRNKNHDAQHQSVEEVQDPRQVELDKLEESFVKLRNATGVSRTEDVLNRFLAQKATKEKLKKMQANAEEEKIQLEKRRQQLTVEIEMHKFSETKDSDQNADKVEKLDKQIEEQRDRQDGAAEKMTKHQNTLKRLAEKLLSFCDKLRESGLVVVEEKTDTLDAMKVLNKLNGTINKFIATLGGPESFNQFLDQMLSDKIEAASLETASEPTKPINLEDQPLFPLFAIITIPTTQAQPSEDEEDIPSRSFLKRQAQLLVDTKSRRKGFALRR
ncbi:outer dynein arm-docking complex subunit 3 [Phymastichus coffea]|uniref:outer dynein arm-docking complex subunit 3 n=1 Tax=Phymastichus coffea TaxID=108790 RepID=UPI00273B7CCD|nr:outer dynein arm-docking complex subunit 3 [Phymastichus coffea]